LSEVYIQMLVVMDEPIEKIKKRVQHMISKWPLQEKPAIYVDDITMSVVEPAKIIRIK